MSRISIEKKHHYDDTSYQNDSLTQGHYNLIIQQPEILKRVQIVIFFITR